MPAVHGTVYACHFWPSWHTLAWAVCLDTPSHSQCLQRTTSLLIRFLSTPFGYKLYLFFPALKYQLYLSFPALKYQLYLSFPALKYQLYLFFPALKYQLYLFSSFYFGRYSLGSLFQFNLYGIFGRIEQDIVALRITNVTKQIIFRIEFTLGSISSLPFDNCNCHFKINLFLRVVINYIV